MISRATYETALLQFFAPLVPLFENSRVTEIVLNGPEQIYVEAEGRLERVPIAMSREDLLGALRVVAQYVGRHFDEGHPILEAHLPSGARLEAVLDPVALGGPAVAIRKHQTRLLTPEQLVALGALSRDALELLSRLIQSKKNLLISGGTGSGKTALLRCFASMASDDERIVVLEDARELRLEKPHVVSLETRPPDGEGRGALTMADLFRATLRLRPDRIVMGEVRGAEALDLIQAMNSGHGGCLSTLHASNPAGALRRLETLASSSDVHLSPLALRSQVAHAVDWIIQTERLPEGRRGVTEIAEVRGVDEAGHFVAEPRFVRQGKELVERGGEGGSL
jgi:pilus assembly protein CpaF